MRKRFLQELILPAFWLFFFIAVKTGEKSIPAKGKTKLQKQMMSGNGNAEIKSKGIISTKALYLPGF